MPRRSIDPYALFVIFVAFLRTTTTLGFSASQTAIKIQRSSLTGLKATSGLDDPAFQYSPTSLQHLENTELPDDYSRPWTATKFKALAVGMSLGTVMGVGGEIIFQSLFDIEKTFVLWGGLGIGAGWFLGGGREVAEAEKPINGGYDRKLIADRPSRMQSVLKSISQSQNGSFPVDSSALSTRDLTKAKTYAAKVHTNEYLEMLESKSRETDRPIRLNPVYSRTLIDQHSYGAALNAVADWMESVDSALQDRPKFGLVRPPGHHACRSKGMGGCLLNSAAAAAVYALDQPSIKSVAILDIDAHHGNGIAHCIQDIPGIRYCSIHEDASSGFLGRSRDDPDDPRSAATDDIGPLGNIRNINLPSGATWEKGYREALEESAIPFLTENNPDILLVAAGFDALEADLTSKLSLQPSDFKKIAETLKQIFGSRVAMGLEGGYCWQGGELNEAILCFVEPWRQEVSQP
jgi:acetoin utilization deacetylase AcuC-like enzyme